MIHVSYGRRFGRRGRDASRQEVQLGLTRTAQFALHPPSVHLHVAHHFPASFNRALTLYLIIWLALATRLLQG